MKRILAALALAGTFALSCLPAFADGTINTLSNGTALAGTELIPMFQTANPAVNTTPSAISTYFQSLVTGDCTMSAGTITCTKTNGTAFGALATLTPGSGVATALGIAVGSAGSPVVNGGALGTPASGVGTNLTGTASGFTAGHVTTNANLTGDVTSVGNATTLATVNTNVGSFGSATNCTAFTTNGKGLITAASQTTCTPALASITGLGTGVATALAIAPGTTGSFTTQDGAITTGNCLKWGPGIQDAGAACGSGGSGTVTSVGAGCGTSTGGSAITTSGNVSAAITRRANTATTDTIVNTDCGNLVSESNASSIAVSIAQAGTTGFAAGAYFEVCNIGAGTATITPTTSTIGGASTLPIPGGSAAAPVCYAFQSDGTNYNLIDGPTVNASLLSSGVVAAARGGAGTITGALKGNGSGTVSQAACADLSNGTALCSTTPGTGVATAAGNNLSAAGGLTSTIFHGTAALGTSAISAGTCATAVNVTAANVATTDVVTAGFAADPTATTGFLPTAMLTIVPYVASAGNIGVKVCNLTGSSITPSALTINVSAVR